VNHGLNTRATELLFLKWFIDHLAPGGRAGVIVPNGVLFGMTAAARTLRRRLLDECKLHGVITMPAGMFKPYASVGTAVLVFEKGGRTKSVWFYEMTADGFSLSDARTPVSENDIPDIIASFPGRKDGARSFTLSRAELAEGEDTLTPGRYREQSAEAVAHESPIVILDDLDKIESEIINEMSLLRRDLAR
jgi:type I restriction enzyme M protein